MEFICLFVGLFIGYFIGVIHVLKEIFVDSTKEEIIEFWDEIQEKEEYHERA